LPLRHLYNASLVGSPNPPTNAFGGRIGAEEGPQIGGATGLDIGLNGIVVCMDGLNGDVAEIIDVNFDNQELINKQSTNFSYTKDFK
jgi:hypothetical protein